MVGLHFVFTLLGTTLWFVPPGDSARILGVFTLLARSHHQFIHPLMAALAQAGHDVIVYSHFPHQQPPANYSDVYLGDFPVMDSWLNSFILETLEHPHWKSFDSFFAPADKVFQRFIENSKIQELIHSKQRFDLVISESFAMQEFTLVFGHIFNAPVISVQSFVTHKILSRTMGNPLGLSYLPDSCLSLPSHMTFTDRLLNTLFSVRALWYVYDFKYIPLLDSMMERHFPGTPPLQDLVQNVSLVFVNDHLTADYPQPRTPNIIPVAGIHIGPRKPLPNDIQQFMDQATHGVIYFSLGTYVPDNLRPEEYFSLFSKVFRQLPQRVLWKTRKDNIEDLPDNVKLAKWLPQRDILSHPKCVLFVTHGGLLSLHETVHNGVPVVVIPHVFDQHRNARFYVEKGVGISLDLQTLTYEAVLTAIRGVLGDNRYKSNMARLSQIFQDRPMSPRDTVVYWTEYVLKHGSSHLRPASSSLAWYQRALLDVITVVVIAVLTLLTIVYCIIRTFLRFISKNSELRSIKDKRI